MINIINQHILHNYFYFPGWIVMLYSIRYSKKEFPGYFNRELTEKGYYCLLIGFILIAIGHFIKIAIYGIYW